MKHFITIILATFTFLMMPLWAHAADNVAAHIQMQNSKYMAGFNAGDTDAVMALHTKDVRVMMSGKPISVGAAAVRVAIAAETSGPAKLTLKLETTELDATEQMAYEKGLWTMLIEVPDEANVTETGPYLVIWKKVGEEWLIHFDAVFPDQSVKP